MTYRQLIRETFDPVWLQATAWTNCGQGSGRTALPRGDNQGGQECFDMMETNFSLPRQEDFTATVMTWKAGKALFFVDALILLTGICAEVRPARAQTHLDCPLSPGVTSPPEPSVTAQDVEIGGARGARTRWGHPSASASRPSIAGWTPGRRAGQAAESGDLEWIPACAGVTA